MTDSKRNKDKSVEEPVVSGDEAQFSHDELEELKRELRSAKITEWVQANRQQLITGIAIFVLVLAGASLWIEQQRSTRGKAAVRFHQAMSSVESEQRTALLSSLVSDFSGTAYAALAHMQLARLDPDSAPVHLKAVIDASSVSEEFAWQARLDLAEYHLNADNKSEAMPLLSSPTGKSYEQKRHYLMARASESDAERRNHLEQALAAESHDAYLKEKIEAELAKFSTAAGE